MFNAKEARKMTDETVKKEQKNLKTYLKALKRLANLVIINIQLLRI